MPDTPIPPNTNNPNDNDGDAGYELSFANVALPGIPFIIIIAIIINLPLIK